MTDTKGYGIGVYPFIIKDKVFEAAAVWHDIAYTKGSWHQQTLTRSKVDQHFLEMMLQVADTPLRRLRAWSYYRVVRLIGWIFWEGRP